MTEIKPPNPTYVGPAKWKGSATNKPIKRIVIHCTAGTEPGVRNSARNTVAYSKRTDRPSSYHYIADAEEHLQYVYDSVVAYHAPPNDGSLGYELCCSLSGEGKGHWEKPDHVAMLKLVVADVARLCAAYDIPVRRLTLNQARNGEKGLMGHDDVRDAWGQTSHWDPGPYFPWAKFLNDIKAEIKRLQTPVEPPKPSRGGRVDHAIEDLSAAPTGKGLRGKRIRAAIALLRKIKPR